MQCWKCGTTIDLTPRSRVSRNDSCQHCHSDLHACKNCRFHDPTVHNQCRETQAEWVSDRERANFCDYFSPSATTAGASPGAAAQNAKSAFDRLFED